MVTTPGLTTALGDDVDRVEILTVGIDIGSSTSHLLFSRVRLQRLATDLSSRYVVVERVVLWRSSIVLTPYRRDGLIDAEALGDFVTGAYRAAGIRASAVDSGAVILTGEALRRRNARAIAEELATTSGDFVCASAGHHLEAVLSAHGSGAVAGSRDGGSGVHIDIGGGTTKLAVLRDGQVLATAAVAVGGRLVAYDEHRRVTRAETTVRPVLDWLGLPLRVGDMLSEEDERRVTATLADVLAAVIDGTDDAPCKAPLLLTTPLPAPITGSTITFSGGVAEYMAGREGRHFGDLAPSLADAVARRMEEAGHRIIALDAGIRATVTGASQFSVQVSGSTIGADAGLLPLRNLPIVTPGVVWDEDIDAERVAATITESVRRRQAGVDTLAFPGLGLAWSGNPSYPRLLATAKAVSRAWTDGGRLQPLVVVFDRDVAASFARVIRSLPDAPPALVVLDGLELGELDYIDIGKPLQPAGVVPVVVKSLLFGA